MGSVDAFGSIKDLLVDFKILYELSSGLPVSAANVTLVMGTTMF